eukprot:TRINITY_DN9086_c0_g1_i1.p5 TRINITY_DN9086_c0_g1~~TRINITY_DN9086_c0_g1_i1.p5  ORF type:complete len:101 (+),score=32.39 TRINITY_DN9086_c0_g1_i1:146-448(+)
MQRGLVGSEMCIRDRYMGLVEKIKDMQNQIEEKEKAARKKPSKRKAQPKKKSNPRDELPKESFVDQVRDVLPLKKSLVESTESKPEPKEKGKEGKCCVLL